MAFSGPAVHHLGSRGTFGLLSVAPALTLLAAWALPEPKSASTQKVGVSLRRRACTHYRCGFRSPDDDETKLCEAKVRLYQIERTERE